MPFDVNVARSKFPGLARRQGELPVVFLDAPAGTQVPRSVVDRMSDMMLFKNSNAGGFYATSRDADEAIANAHRAAEQFVNARKAGEVHFGQSMTSLTFAISRSIGAMLKYGDEIILSRMDHDANISPWLILAEDLGLTIRWLEFSPETYEFDLDQLNKLLNQRTKLVCVCYASNVTGTVNDIAGITR